MALPDTLVAHWWHLLVGAHATMFVVGIILWVAGNEPIAVLLVILALLLPLAVVAVALDGLA